VVQQDFIALPTTVILRGSRVYEFVVGYQVITAERKGKMASPPVLPAY
jgi:hypothetical protein